MTRHVLGLSIAGLLGLSMGAFAQSTTDSTNAGKEGRTNREVALARTALATGSARALLRKPVAEVEWDEATLEDVVEWLRDQGENRVNVIFRWTALGVEGIDRDSPVSLQLRDTFVGDVLVEVVDQLSPSGGMTFHGMENKLVISTKAELNRKLHVRVYEVTDLMFQVPDMGRSAPIVDLEQAARAGGGGGGGSGQSIFAGTTSGSDELEVEEQEVEERIEDLRTLITVTISPDTWNLDGKGLGLGQITVFDNRYLVVRNTPEVHEELVGYFSLNE